MLFRSAEGLTDAVMASLQTQAQAGAIPPQDIAEIARFVRTNRGDLFAAIDHVQRLAQERQATAGEPGTPTGPALPGSPEAQPGLTMPGVGLVTAITLRAEVGRFDRFQTGKQLARFCGVTPFESALNIS